jgi:hypothetical protein
VLLLFFAVIAYTLIFYISFFILLNHVRAAKDLTLTLTSMLVRPLHKKVFFSLTSAASIFMPMIIVLATVDVFV